MTLRLRYTHHRLFGFLLLVTFVTASLPLEILAGPEKVVLMDLELESEESGDEKPGSKLGDCEFEKIAPENPRAHASRGKVGLAWMSWHSRSFSLHVVETDVPPPEINV